MSNVKLSQIAAASSPPGVSDQLVGVSGGTTDNLFTLTQISTTIGASASSFGWQNIKSYGAVGDGITNDSQAFLDFQTYAQAQTTPVVLVCPPGSYNNINAGTFYRGISNLIIYAYGATLANMDAGGTSLYLAPLGVQSARIATTAVGNTTVTLLNLALASIFTVGDVIVISSIDMQGPGNFPPNWYHFEFRKITNINAGTGVISLDGRLRYAHLSTYIDPSLGDPVQDTGGPASIFNIHQLWAQNLTIYGATIGGSGQGFTAQFLTCVDVTFAGTTFNIAPSVGERILFDRCTFTGAVALEPDKVITHIEFKDCIFKVPIFNQSASIDRMIFDGCEMLSPLAGTTPKMVEIKNSYLISIAIGQFGFGPSGKVLLENNQIDTVLPLNENMQPIGNVTFSNGTFAMPIVSANTAEFWAFAVPGNQMFFNGTGLGLTNWGFPFIVTAIRQDGTNYYADTTLQAVPMYAFAPPDVGSPVPANLVPHPAARLAAKDNTGDQAILDLSKQVGEQPLYSYGRRLLTGNLFSGYPSAIITAWGTIVKIRINVLQAYTGAQAALNLFFTAQNGTFYLDTTTTPGTGIWTRWTPSLNLKIAGERVIMPGSVTGLQAGDSVVTPGAWWSSGFLPFFDVDISGDTFVQWPIVDMEVFTDQGINGIPALFVGPNLITQ